MPAWGKPMALGLLTSVLCWIVFTFTPVYWLSVRVTDGLLRWVPMRADPRIVVVTIDDRSLQALGRFPLDRKVYAAMLERLHRAGAKVVAFDILFVEPSPSDNALAEAMRRFDKVVLGVGLTVDRDRASPLPPRFLLSVTPCPAPLPITLTVVPPPPLLTNACALLGFVTPFPDADGVCRRFPVALRWQRKDRRALPSLGMAAWALWNGGNAVRLPAGAVSGVTVVVPQSTKPVAFATLPLIRVVQGDFEPRSVRNKVVLVGLTASGLSDRLPTATDPLAFGVEIHAAVINTLLSGRNWVTVNELVQAALMVLIGGLFGVAGANRRPQQCLLTFAGVSVGGTVAVAVLMLFGVVLPPLPLIVTTWGCLTVVIAWLLNEHWRVYEQLSPYLPYPLTDAFVQNPEQWAVGERREISVLFSDIRNFARVSATLEPYEVVTLLDNYFTRMAEIVNLYGGMVDKFLGDGMMVLFGVSANQFDHAERAVICACHMLEELESLQHEWQRVTGEPLRVGIGVHTGTAIVSAIGSTQRKEFTALGATVNLAQRLEQLTKDLKAALIISADTYERVADLVDAEPIVGVTVRGFEETPMTVYRVNGLKPEMRHLRAQFWVAAP